MYFVSLTPLSSSRNGGKFEFLKYMKLLSAVTLDSLVIFVQLYFPLKEQYLNLNFNLPAMCTRTPNSTEHACFGFWSKFWANALISPRNSRHSGSEGPQEWKGLKRKTLINLQVTVPSAFRRIQVVEVDCSLLQVIGIRMILPDSLLLLSWFH